MHNQRGSQMEIRKLRKQLNMSQQQFADKFGISVRTLQGWENGRPVPGYVGKLLNKSIWMEEILKLKMVKGEYDEMAAMIETTEYENELIEKIKEEARQREEYFKAMPPEERERLDAEHDCALLNFDLEEEFGSGREHEYRPIYVEGIGWSVKKFKIQK